MKLFSYLFKFEMNHLQIIFPFFSNLKFIFKYDNLKFIYNIVTCRKIERNFILYIKLKKKKKIQKMHFIKIIEFPLNLFLSFRIELYCIV